MLQANQRLDKLTPFKGTRPTRRKLGISQKIVCLIYTLFAFTVRIMQILVTNYQIGRYGAPNFIDCLFSC